MTVMDFELFAADEPFDTPHEAVSEEVDEKGPDPVVGEGLGREPRILVVVDGVGVGCELYLARVEDLRGEVLPRQDVDRFVEVLALQGLETSLTFMMGFSFGICSCMISGSIRMSYDPSSRMKLRPS